MILLTDKVWTDRAANRRRVEIVHCALLFQGVLRLETLDEIDKRLRRLIGLTMVVQIAFDAPVTTATSTSFFVFIVLLFVDHDLEG